MTFSNFANPFVSDIIISFVEETIVESFAKRIVLLPSGTAYPNLVSTLPKSITVRQSRNSVISPPSIKS